MRTFVEALKRPSAAVQAMIDGLLTLDKEPGIEIDMRCYCRKKYNSGCLVCAATAAALQATQTPGKTLVEYMTSRGESCDDWSDLAAVLNHPWDDVVRFEVVMNSLRLGSPDQFLDYFEVESDHPSYDLEPGFVLRTDDWREQIPAAAAYRDKLIELGL